MKKILLVINAHKPDTVSTQFAAQFASDTKSGIIGLFVDNVYHRPETLHAKQEYFKAIAQKEEEAPTTMDATQSVKLFKDICNQYNLKVIAQKAHAEPIQETLYQSRYADLLIVDPKIDFYDLDESLPSHFAKEILANAECPVLLAPDKETEIKEIVFCFDGTSSSAYALKQFTYLFPQFSKTPILLLEVNKSGRETFNEGHQQMMDWLKANYEDVRFELLQGIVKDELFTFFFKKTDKLIVMGSYGRNALSSFFKRSTADVLIRSIDLPIFITH